MLDRGRRGVMKGEQGDGEESELSELSFTWRSKQHLNRRADPFLCCSQVDRTVGEINRRPTNGKSTAFRDRRDRPSAACRGGRGRRPLGLRPVAAGTTRPQLTADDALATPLELRPSTGDVERKPTLNLNAARRYWSARPTNGRSARPHVHSGGTARQFVATPDRGGTLRREVNFVLTLSNRILQKT
ncbi:hypothetical protein EVAR_76212_1 [Eumeta japonica]|uniref:Uncharacterized protein n=1 Tax=Eumeta variegata TaxID=151549 RepID=A0A4C1UNR5_EUMVA|nr:hypothetical protein EVAR_76212_1 [Eumeta japonica]